MYRPRHMTLKRLTRAVAIGFILGALPGCASRPPLPDSCQPNAFAQTPLRAGDSQSACEAIADGSRAALAGVQQTGGQTRTVGVPRSFMVTLLVLILLFSLA